VFKSKGRLSLRPRKAKRGADLISDALPRALPSVGGPTDVMNQPGLFGHLGRRYRNHKAVQIGQNRAAGVISWFDTLMPNFFRKISSARQSDLPQARAVDSSSRNAVSISSARTKRFPSPRCAISQCLQQSKGPLRQFAQRLV
jgi:hypothetical protein